VKGFFVIFLTALIMRWMAAQSRAAKARRIGQDWIFPPTRALQMVSVLGLTMGGVFAIFGFLGPQSDRNLLVIGGLLILAFAGATWPKAVWLSDSGFRQRSWCCRWKRISWSKVSEVKEKGDGSVVIRGKETKIVLSQFHADRKLFLEKVRGLSPAGSVSPLARQAV
jgi:hypothetical protein